MRAFAGEEQVESKRRWIAFFELKGTKPQETIGDKNVKINKPDEGFFLPMMAC